MALFNSGPAEAVTGPIEGEPFPVLISKTLVSLDINGDGDALDPGDVPTVSSYTFTLRSAANFTSTTAMIIAFPAGYDLTGRRRD